MGTSNFNIIDNIIAYLRLNKINKYIKKDSIVLDFGCGNQAYFLKHIKNKIKEGIGLDYDVRTKKILPNIRLVKFKYSNRLPYPNNYFNQVYMLAVLEHLKPNEVDSLFKEFKRVLKINGQVILTTPTQFSKPILEFLAFKLHLISTEEIADHKKYYNKEDIDKIVYKAGFVIEEYKQFQFGLNSYIVLKNK
jgi:ubiquinone/menaquinone biosynthesis C-methylase UbiE